MIRQTSNRRPAELREATEVARSLFEKLGDGALWLVRFRADALTADGDLAGAKFWSRVGRAVRLLTFRASQASTDPDARHPRRSLGVFGAVETYLHRAAEAEHRAARSPGAHREELLEIAAQWRALAHAAQALAQTRPRATEG